MSDPRADEDFYSDEVVADWIRDGPSVLGIETMADCALVVRVVADTHPATSTEVERILRERSAKRLEAEVIQTRLPASLAPGQGHNARQQ